MIDMSLSPVALFLAAGAMGKVVMITLFCASIWCWLSIVEGVRAVRRLGGAARAARRGGDLVCGLAEVAEVGAQAVGRPAPGESTEARRLRVGDAMRRSARDLLSAAERCLPGLAVVSSVSPFIGLFGTVWGIMASFSGIAAAHDTSLATVAPGIAEALAATAWGLAAAIPASVAYNRLTAAFGAVATDLDAWIGDRLDDLMLAPARAESGAVSTREEAA